MEANLRYYVHGDQKELEPSLWYCARCDAFVAQAHFYEGHHDNSRVTDYDRYSNSIKRLPIFMENKRGKYHRPYNPPNCVA